MTTYDYDVGGDVPGRSSLGSSGSSGSSATGTLTLHSQAQPNVSNSTFFPSGRLRPLLRKPLRGRRRRCLFVCLFVFPTTRSSGPRRVGGWGGVCRYQGRGKYPDIHPGLACLKTSRVELYLVCPVNRRHPRFHRSSLPRARRLGVGIRYIDRSGMYSTLEQQITVLHTTQRRLLSWAWSVKWPDRTRTRCGVMRCRLW